MLRGMSWRQRVRRAFLDSVVNVSQLLTLDRSFLTEHAGTLPPRLQRSVDEGLRTVLQL
jgi:mRNA interferase MazF